MYCAFNKLGKTKIAINQKISPLRNLQRSYTNYFNPKTSSADMSKTAHKFAKVSRDGNLSKRMYLLMVDGLIPSRSAISFCERLLYLMASRKCF